MDLAPAGVSGNLAWLELNALCSFIATVIEKFPIDSKIAGREAAEDYLAWT